MFRSFSRFFLLRDRTRFIMTRFILARFIMLRLSRRWRAWRREIGPGQLCQFIAELLAQYPGANFFDFAFAKLTELERPERDANEPSDAQSEMAEHIAHLAVLALADAEREPHVAALHAIERGFDRTVMHTIDSHAAVQAVKLVLRDRAVRTHAITPQPSRRGQFQKSCQRAVIGQKQQAFGIEIEPPDADQARLARSEIAWVAAQPFGEPDATKYLALAV